MAGETAMIRPMPGSSHYITYVQKNGFQISPLTGFFQPVHTLGYVQKTFSNQHRYLLHESTVMNTN
jgi:hypothetical protein